MVMTKSPFTRENNILQTNEQGILLENQSTEFHVVLDDADSCDHFNDGNQPIARYWGSRNTIEPIGSPRISH